MCIEKVLKACLSIICCVFISGNSRIFSCTGEEVTRQQFSNGGNYTAALREGSFEIFGDRVTKLGTNM